MHKLRQRHFHACLAMALTALVTAAAGADVPGKLVGNSRVQSALHHLQADDAATFREQIEISEIPAPPFKESVRARDYLRRLQALGLEDAYIDSTGNVIGVRKGTRGRPLLVLSAHLDTVFPEGTDVKVTERDGRFHGRGLADDGRGLAALLTLLRAMEQAICPWATCFSSTWEKKARRSAGVKGLLRDHQHRRLHLGGFHGRQGRARRRRACHRQPPLGDPVCRSWRTQLRLLRHAQRHSRHGPCHRACRRSAHTRGTQDHVHRGRGVRRHLGEYHCLGREDAHRHPLQRRRRTAAHRAQDPGGDRQGRARGIPLDVPRYQGERSCYATPRASPRGLAHDWCFIAV